MCYNTCNPDCYEYMCVCMGFSYFNAAKLFVKVSQPSPVQRLCRAYIMKALCLCMCIHTHTHTCMCMCICVCVYVCIYIRACINLGGLCNEALGISDCVTLIRCLVNDELERMWKEVVVA